MAITKIQKNAFPTSIDLSSVDLTIGANEIITANIADANVTHAKLHTDMDLTSKTVVLPKLNQALQLEVSDNSEFLNVTITGNESWAFKGASGNGIMDYVSFGISGSTQAMAWQEDGNVGIGVTSPLAKLHVSGQTSFGPAGQSYAVLDVLPGTAAVGQTTIVRAYNSNNLQLTTYNGSGYNDGIVVSVAGNVGIGTSNPESTLHVAKAGNGIFTIERSNKVSGTGRFGINVENNSQTTVAYDTTSKFVIGRSSDPTTQSGFNNDFVIDSNGFVGIGNATPSVQFQVINEWYGVPYLDIMKLWRSADLQGYTNSYPDGGSISYTWYSGGVVKIDSSVGSHNWDVGEIYLEAGTYFILMQYRPSPDQHGWNVYGTNSNGHSIRLQTNGGYGAYNTLTSVYGQAGKDDRNSIRYRSGTYQITQSGVFRIGMGTQPYVTGGYKCWIENAYLMKMS